MRFNFEGESDETTQDIILLLEKSLENYGKAFSEIGYNELRQGFIYGLGQAIILIQLNRGGLDD